MAGATTRVLTIAVQEIEELLRPSLRLGARVEPANNLVAFPDSIRLAASLAIIDNLDLTWLQEIFVNNSLGKMSIHGVARPQGAPLVVILVTVAQLTDFATLMSRALGINFAQYL